MAIGGTFTNKNNPNPLLNGEVEQFDKIVNLRFIRKKGGKDITIRSDYEPVFHRDGTVSFTRCAQKPDIKIEYKQVAEGTAIEVDIYVTNFFVGGGDTLDEKSMNTVGGNPVERCIIQMGYRHQFPDWTKPEVQGNIHEFYNLINRTTPENMGIQAGNQMIVQILTGYPQSYPPDRVTYFKGIVGSIDKGLRWDHSAALLVQGYGNADFPPGKANIEAELFQLISRRFIRPNILHMVETSQPSTNKERITETAEEEETQKVTVLESLIEGARNREREDRKVLVLLDEEGIMSIEDAKTYGIPIVISDTLRNIKYNGVYGHNTVEEGLEVITPIPATLLNEQYETIGGQLRAIQKHYPFLRWYILPTGTYYFYHERDTDRDLWNDVFIKELRKNPVYLPAIYDMTPQGTRTIRCPFVSIVSPMMTVVFESRYIIGSDVGFFYPPNTNNFLVILADIKFATVQEDNMMELRCVDLPRLTYNEEEEEDPETEAPVETPETSQVPSPVNMKWHTREWEVVRHLANNDNRRSSWGNMVEILLASVVQNNPDHWPKGPPTRRDALEALREWNKEYFDPGGPYMKRYDKERGISLENTLPSGIVAQTGVDFQVPWLLPEDIIIIHVPFQSQYPDDQFQGVLK